MKLAIMQPYLFPYIGYFQLIKSVDKFVIYDDVAFIKQGWINKNRILLNGTPFNFTLPLENTSSFKNINQTFISKTRYKIWKNKFHKTLHQAYLKAPQFNKIYPIVENILSGEYDSIGNLSSNSLRIVCEYLSIKTEFINSSTMYNNHNLTSQARVIDICKKEKATQYINLMGGITLYSKEEFMKNSLELNFLKSIELKYSQNNSDFIPWLSIIDILMFNSKDIINNHLNSFVLV